MTPRILSFRDGPFEAELLAEAAEHLGRGGVLAIPTETVYGFSCAAEGPPVEKLMRLKGRGTRRPFLLVIPTAESVSDLSWSGQARRLADSFWPGALTLILPDVDERFPPGVRSREGGVAVRVSSHPLVQALLAVFARPLISTSANSPGSLPARTATQALAAGLALGMGDDLWLLDGGPLEPSDPSTIVDCTRPEPMVVRPGAIPLEWLRSVVPEIGESTEAPEAHMRLLFVCSGNTCRSPLAEALARRAARRLGLGELEVRSAGVGTLPGQPASEGARKAARSHGLDLGGHLSVPLDRELVRWADLILTMDSTHLRRVLELGGEGKSALLGAYAGGRSGPGASDPSLEVPDPFGRDDGAYERTLRLLERYVDSVMGLLAKEAKE